METHVAAGTRSRVITPDRGPIRSANDQARSRRRSLTDWPVARRLFAVILAALLMGLVFGGLRVAAAENSARQLGQTEQLAKLSAELLPVVDDLQSERDATLVALITNRPARLSELHAKTSRDLAPARVALQQVVNGGYPATVASAAGAVNNALSPGSIAQLQGLFNTATPSGDVVSPDYGSVISDIITLQGQVALGITDPSLTTDVQTLTALAQAEDLTSQQQAKLDQSLSNDNPASAGYGFLDIASVTSLQVTYAEEFTQEALFQSKARPDEAGRYDTLLGPQAARLSSEDKSDQIEQALFTVAGGQAATPSMLSTAGISYPQFIKHQPLNPAASKPTTPRQDGIATTAALKAGTRASMPSSARCRPPNSSSRATSRPGPASSCRPRGALPSSTSSSPWWSCSWCWWPPCWSPGPWFCRCVSCARAPSTSLRCSCPNECGCCRRTRSPPRPPSRRST
jgi:hypothetical protein